MCFCQCNYKKCTSVNVIMTAKSHLLNNYVIMGGNVQNTSFGILGIPGLDSLCDRIIEDIP